MISTRGRYALRIMVDLAENQGDGFVTLRDLAERQDISEKYLESIVKDLVRTGLLSALRGKGGGYRLGRSAGTILVIDVLRATESSLAPVACLAGGTEVCPRAAYCRTLPLWEGLDKVVTSYLSSFSLEDLAKRDNFGFDYVI